MQHVKHCAAVIMMKTCENLQHVNHRECFQNAAITFLQSHTATLRDHCHSAVIACVSHGGNKNTNNWSLVSAIKNLKIKQWCCHFYTCCTTDEHVVEAPCTCTIYPLTFGVIVGVDVIYHPFSTSLLLLTLPLTLT